MALPKEFWEELPDRSDEELYGMLADSHAYLPEALSAAEAELEKRNLPPQFAADLQAAAEAEQLRETAPKNSKRSFQFHVIVLFLHLIAGVVWRAFK
jgi:hypothetical protein